MYMRQRRTTAQKTSPAKPLDQTPRRQQHVWAPTIWQACLALSIARLISAACNIIHDCDEVFNYWEPLHYLLYGYGLQTWEYSKQFALRSYLYLLLHLPVAAPLAAILNASTGKLVVFYGVRVALAAASVLSETLLYRATLERISPQAARVLLILLTTLPGMFASSTALLPSSFTMYAMTTTASAILLDIPPLVIAAAAVGILWGWVVAGAAFVPCALWVLWRGPLRTAWSTATVAAIGTLGPLVVLDRLFYGTWTVSLWNFVRYNVVGGGDSALYGVEGPLFYLVNGALNLNGALAAALAAPLALGGAALLSRLRTVSGNAPPPPVALSTTLVAALTPCFVWLAAISVLPHKEERFLYVVYPLLALAASLTLTTQPWLVATLCQQLARVPRTLGARIGRVLMWAQVVVVVALSLSRTAALVHNYGAPMYVYRQLPAEPPPSPTAPPSMQPRVVCVGTEWYRFPSSFFLPGPSYRLQFVKSGFDGLLPHAFDPAAGGTSAAPSYFNDRNKADPRNYWTSTKGCHYLVGWNAAAHEPLYDARKWRAIATYPFLDASKSSSLYRALYLPGVSVQHNSYSNYTLYGRARG